MPTTPTDAAPADIAPALSTAAALASPTPDPTPAVHRRARCAGDRGEGVISAAIAVLVMALLGAAMWVAFNRIWTDTEARTEQKVSQIGE